MKHKPWTAADEERLCKRLGGHWPKIRQEIRAGKVQVIHHVDSGIPNTWTSVMYVKDGEWLLATLWYWLMPGCKLVIEYMHTVEQAQRCGAMAKLFQHTMSQYPTIARACTAAGNRKSTPWLLKNGFKREEGGDWVWERPLSGNRLPKPAGQA